MRPFLSACAAAAAFALAACGGGGGGSSSMPAPAAATATPGAGTSALTAAASFAVSLQQYAPVKTSSTARKPAFLSPATASITLAVVSVDGTPTSGTSQTFPVGANATSCSSVSGVVTCTLTMNLPIGTDVLSATTVDANGTTLGTSQIAATVVQNASNKIPLAVGGQIASLQMYLQHSSFTPGTSENANVYIIPLDASGAAIVNPGNYVPPITVTAVNNAGHFSLITNGTSTGLSSTINSPNDQLVLAYDGGGTSGTISITASAGSGVTATRSASYAMAGLSASPGGTYVVSTNGFIFSSAGQTGTVTVSGGTPPYTIASSDSGVATTSGSGPSFTVSSTGYGTNGTATLTISDNAGGHTTIPVTFLAPAVALAVTTCGSGNSCSTGTDSAQVTYATPANGTPSISAATITASGGTGTFGYVFASSGTSSSPYMTVSQSGSAFTITPNGSGSDAVLITSGNRTAYIGVSGTGTTAAYGITSISEGYAPNANTLNLAWNATQGIAGTASLTLTAANAPWTITNNCSGVATLTNSNNAVTVVAANSSGTCTVNFTPATGSAPTALTINGMHTLAATSTTYSLHAIGDTFSDAITGDAPAGLSIGGTSITETSGGAVISLNSYASGTLSMTTTGFGTSRISIHDTVSDERVGVAVTVDNTFAQSLPAAVGMRSGVAYSSSTLPSTVASGSVIAGSTPNGFSVVTGSPGTLSANPVASGHGTIRFLDSLGGHADVPFTVFGLTFSNPGSAVDATADEAFTSATGSGTVSVSGNSGTLTAASSNTGVVTASVSGTQISLTAVAAGTSTITVTDSNGASVTFTVSVTTTTIPVASRARR